MAIDNNADFTPSIPDSDVVPTKLPYNQRGGFKFWAQKVIPLVYNDSLSYYEVLCKVVNYLNNVIQNVDNLNESVNSTNQSFETLKEYVNTTKDTLINTYNELQDYVNTYFDNLDVQEEINAKLDAMADSGELTNLLAPFIPDLVTQWLNNHVTPTSPVVDNTLSISGAAADAKVTGDNFTELKEELNADVDQLKNALTSLNGDVENIDSTLFKTKSESGELTKIVVSDASETALKIVSTITNSNSAIVRVSRKNLFDLTNDLYQTKNIATADPSTGTITATNTYSYGVHIGVRMFLPKGDYCCSCSFKPGYYVSVYEGTTYIATAIPANALTGQFSIAKSGTYNIIMTAPANETVQIVGFQLETGNTVSEFEAFSGIKYTQQFSDTVASGSYNWKTGVLTVDGSTEEYIARQISGSVGNNYVLSESGQIEVNWGKDVAINDENVAELTENVAELTENVDYVVQNKKIYQSKNLFDKNAVIDGYYIHSVSGVLSRAAHASVSPLMPIEAGKVYHLFRDGLGGTHEIRFVAEDGVTPMKALNEDGTEYSLYTSANSPTVKAPEGAAYFQCTVRFNNMMDTYDSIQFEEGNTQTSYEPYVRYDYLDYTALPHGLKGLPEKVHDLETLSNVESITIANSSKIGFFSNSFLNGYTMRTHHALDNLGMWSDYIMYNYGKSGDDALECLARINDNQSFFGDVPVQDYGLTYGVIAMQDNDGALYAADYNTYYQNFKKIAEALRAMGATPILGSEHDTATNYYGLMALAQEEGYLFMDWGKLASQTGKFTPMWHNGHPATRTAWLWTYGMLPYIENLPRPVKGIKLFRKRPDTGTTLQELTYNNVYERAERYVEIDNGYSCLTQETEKYFDRLNNNLTVYEYLKDEYQKLQAKTGSVSFGTHALIECITPYDAKNISSLKIKLNATGATNAYLKRVLSLSNPLPAQRFIAFGVTAGADLLTAGTQFTITGGVFNDNILGTYVVDSVINGIVVTRTSSSGKTTSGTDNPTTNISGVTLQGSYDYPSVDYMQRFKQPLAEWDAIEINTNGETDLSVYLKSHMDYDKLAILLVGNDILLTNVEFTVAGSDKKNGNLRKPIKKALSGTSLITDTLLDDDTAWDNISEVTKYTPVVSGVDGTTREPLPTGISTVRIIQSGESISQTFNTASLNQDPYHLDHVQIRVLARYFPKYIANDTDWQTTEIYEGSYDCAKLSVSFDEASDCWTGHIGAFWNEFIIDAYYQPSNRTHKLRIKCNDKSIQIAKVEMVLVDD